MRRTRIHKHKHKHTYLHKAMIFIASFLIISLIAYIVTSITKCDAFAMRYTYRSMYASNWWWIYDDIDPKFISFCANAFGIAFLSVLMMAKQPTYRHVTRTIPQISSSFSFIAFIFIGKSIYIFAKKEAKSFENKPHNRLEERYVSG